MTAGTAVRTFWIVWLDSGGSGHQASAGIGSPGIKSFGSTARHRVIWQGSGLRVNRHDSGHRWSSGIGLSGLDSGHRVTRYDSGHGSPESFGSNSGHRVIRQWQDGLR
ncbi:unnamed protein product, partial [Staurois parvus]